MEERAPLPNDRLEQLSRQVEDLTRRVERLERREAFAAEPRQQLSEGATETADTSEELLTWAGRTSLLPRLSSLCFLLVVALILRTITDSEIIDRQLGSLLGMIYGAGLMVFGWLCYHRQSPLAPIFTVGGAVLTYIIVVETHAHFDALAAVPAYLLLLATGIGMALLSYVYRVALPIMVGTLGMGLAGVAIDYPRPIFPLLALLILGANVLGTVATRLQRCSWLRWILLTVALLVLTAWGLKLQSQLARGVEVSSYLAAAWYFPTVILYFTTFLAISLLGITRRVSDRISRFDLALPTINGLWAFGLSLLVMEAWFGASQWVGFLGTCVGFGHLAGGWGMLQGGDRERVSGIALVVAGTVLLVLSLPPFFGSTLAPLPVLSLLALLLASLSARLGSGAIRLLSYLLQLYAGAGTVLLLRHPEEVPTGWGLLVGALVALMATGHFLWCRRQQPPVDSALFARIDDQDRLAVLLLLAGLVCGFFAIRLGLAATLLAGPTDGHDAFASAQSVLINLSAIALVLLAFAQRNGELRNVAILLLLVGAGRVFGHDLFGVHGFPLVASLFSFGVAAAVGSVVFSRWSKSGDRAARQEGDAARTAGG